MEILLDEHILQYCYGDAADKTRQIDLAVAMGERPARILPTFELCRAIFFGARELQLQPALFRDCWEKLVIEHWQRIEGGYVIHVTPGEDDGTDILGAMLDMGPAESTGFSADEEDIRDIISQHVPMTERLRRLNGPAKAVLEAVGPNQRAWQCEPPESLPTIDGLERAVDNRLVLDSNYFLELINALPVDGRWHGSLSMPERVPARIVRRFRHTLERYGLDGKLIVPISVLEETTRVAGRVMNRYRYLRARHVLGEMRLNADKPLWQAFSFEPLSTVIFDAFLGMHERLVEEEVSSDQWPHFGDALVLAHGIANGCPVASAEWIEKPDWNAVGALFPFLILR